MAALHYRDLVAWQKGTDLVVAVYKLTRIFPREEIYGLTNQLRRAVVSVPSNIAEGQGRGVGNAFSGFLRIANGSLQEVETQILLAERLGYVSGVDVAPALELCAEVGRVLVGLMRSLKAEP